MGGEKGKESCMESNLKVYFNSGKVLDFFYPWLVPWQLFGGLAGDVIQTLIARVWQAGSLLKKALGINTWGANERSENGCREK